MTTALRRSQSETTPQVADVLDRAAHLLHTDGVYIGDWWPHLPAYTDADPCCVIGAIAVAAGHRTATDIDDHIIGLGHEPIHPAVTAVMARLRMELVEEVFDWSDHTQDWHIIEVLREVAAQIRTQEAA